MVSSVVSSSSVAKRNGFFPPRTACPANVVANDDKQLDPDRGAPEKTSDPGAYNMFWLDFGSRAIPIDGKVRTSVIIDPPNGQMPAMTATGRERRGKMPQWDYWGLAGGSYFRTTALLDAFSAPIDWAHLQALEPRMVSSDVAYPVVLALRGYTTYPSDELVLAFLACMASSSAGYTLVSSSRSLSDPPPSAALSPAG